MANVKEAAKMYDALLSIKVLDAPVKLSLKISCRQALQLALVVDQGLSAAGPDNLVRKILPAEDQTSIMELVTEILKKGEVEDFYRNLRELLGPGQGQS